MAGGGGDGGGGAGAGGGGAEGVGLGSGDSLLSVRAEHPLSAGKSVRPSLSSSFLFEHWAAGLGLGEGEGDGESEGVGLGSIEGVGLGVNGTTTGAGGLVLRLMLLTGSSTAVGVSGWSRKYRTNGVAPNRTSSPIFRGPPIAMLSSRYLRRAILSVFSLRIS